MRVGSYQVSLKNKDLLILSIMFGWATLYYIDTGTMGQAELMLALIQPVYFLMAALLVIYLFRTVSLIKIDHGKERTSTVELSDTSAVEMETERKDGQIAPENSRRLFVFLGMACAYVALFDAAGFIGSTIIYVAATMYYLGLRRIPLLLTIPIATSLLIYFIFSKLFYIELPVGMLRSLGN